MLRKIIAAGFQPTDVDTKDLRLVALKEALFANPLPFEVKVEDIYSIMRQYPTLTVPQLILRLWVEIFYSRDPGLNLNDLLVGTPEKNSGHARATYKTLREDMLYLSERLNGDIEFSFFLTQLREIRFFRHNGDIQARSNICRSDGKDLSALLETAMDEAIRLLPSALHQLEFFDETLDLFFSVEVEASLFKKIVDLIFRYLDECGLFFRLDDRIERHIGHGTTDEEFKDVLKAIFSRSFFRNLSLLRLSDINWTLIIIDILSRYLEPRFFSMERSWWIVWELTDHLRVNMNPQGIHTILKRLIKDSLATEEEAYVQVTLFSAFASKFHKQITSAVLPDLMISIFEMKSAWRYKHQLSNMLMAFCENAFGDMGFRSLPRIREALLRGIAPHCQGVDQVLVRLYKLLLFPKWNQCSKFEKRRILQSELEAVTVSHLDDETKLMVVSELSYLVQGEWGGVHIILSKLVEDDPLGTHKAFFLGFVSLVNDRVAPDELNKVLIIIFQTQYSPEYKLQLLSILMDKCKSVWARMEWRALSGIWKKLLEIESPGIFLALERLYDLSHHRVGIHSILQVELQAVIDSPYLNNEFKLRLIRKMDALVETNFVIQVILKRLASDDPLTDEQNRFFLELTALFKYPITPDELTCAIFCIFQTHHNLGYKLRLLKVLIDKCYSCCGHMEWRALVGIREQLFATEAIQIEEAADILERLYHLILGAGIPYLMREHKMLERQTVLRSEFQIVMAVIFDDDRRKLRLLKRIATSLHGSFGLQIVEERLLSRDPMTDTQKSFFLELASFFEYQLPPNEMRQVMYNILQAPQDLEYRLQVLKVVMDHFVTVSGDLNWPFFLDIRESLLSCGFPGTVSILECLYESILFKSEWDKDNAKTFETELYAVLCSNLMHNDKMHLMRKIMTRCKVGLPISFLEKIKTNMLIMGYVEKERESVDAYLVWFLSTREEKIRYLTLGLCLGETVSSSEHRYKMLDELFVKEHLEMTVEEVEFLVGKVRQDPFYPQIKAAKTLLAKLTSLG